MSIISWYDSPSSLILLEPGGLFKRVILFECNSPEAAAFKYLEVEPRSATRNDVKMAYKRLSLRDHPDKEGGSKEKFQALTDAKVVAFAAIVVEMWRQAQ